MCLLLHASRHLLRPCLLLVLFTLVCSENFPWWQPTPRETPSTTPSAGHSHSSYTSVPRQRLRGPPTDFLGAGHPGFVDQSAYVGLAPVHQGSVAAIADFNRDRFVDIALFHSTSLDALQIAFWNHDMFRFEPRGSGLRLTRTAPPSHQTQPRCPLRFMSSVAPADFNNDGIVDLLVGDGDSGCIFFGNGDGDFNESVVTIIPELPTSSLIMDSNADLIPDIFVGFPNGSRGFYQFDAPDAGRSSRPRVPGVPPQPPRTVHYRPWITDAAESCPLVAGDIAQPAFADMDGDCFADLIIPTACGLEVWRNPAATSQNFWDLSTARDPAYFRFFGSEVFNAPHGDGALIFTDFNGDGTIDMAVPNRNRRDMLVFLNIQDQASSRELCSPDDNWRLERRLGIASGLQIDPGSMGPLFGRISIPAIVHVGDYDLDGLPDILAVDASSGSPMIFRNLGQWGSDMELTQAHFAPISDNDALAKAAGSGRAVAAVFFDTDETGRQDIMVIKSRNATSLIWNTFITTSDSLFFKGTCLSALPYHSFYRPFAPVAGNTFKVSYMARRSRHRVTRVCSQCPQSGPWSLRPCNCLFGLLEISNYIEEMTVGAGGATRSWTNLMPNSMAVVWAEDPHGGSPSSADWWMEYFTQRRGGQMLRVVAVLTVALGILGAVILVLQQKERKEDRESEPEHARLFNFGGPL